MRKSQPRGVRAFAHGLGTMDAALFDTVATSPSPLLDAVMPPLSRAADHGKLWFAIAAGLGVSGKPELERGAVRGVAALAVTSLLTNQVAKRVLPRRRPAADLVPQPRRGRRQPTSNSFPSGHAASAAAFAVGVSVEHRPAGLALAALAGLVGLSRVATGAHYPGDVFIGWGLGALIATAGSQLIPPVDAPDIAVAEATVVDEPPRPDGRGVTVLVNPGSGSGSAADHLDSLRQALPAALIVEFGPDEDLVELATTTAAEAEVLGVVGGDGTVAVAAAAALAAGIPLAVFPGGTFNHFARDIGCGTVGDTVEMIRTGRTAKVDVVRLNGSQVILNTASIGAYPDFVRYRERYQHRISRPLATTRAVLHVLRRSQPATIEIDGRPVSTSLFLLGNSMYGSSGLAPRRRRRLDDGLIDVRFIEAGHRLTGTRLLGSVLAGRLTRSHIYREIQAPEFSFTATDPVVIAHDGEAGEPHDRARFTMEYRALQVYGTSVVAG